MVVLTPEGETEKIEHLLDQYSLVITGKIPLEDLLHDQMQIMQLRHKLELANLELKWNQDLLGYIRNDKQERIYNLEEQVRELRSIIGTALAHTREQHKTIQQMIERNHDEIIKAALRTIDNKLHKGITADDEKEIKMALLNIKGRDPSLLGQILDISKHCVSGAGGNLLAQWIVAITGR